MRKGLLAVSLIVGVVVAPGLSFATHQDANCNHSKRNDTAQGADVDPTTGVWIYADTNGRNGGMSQSADEAVGTCATVGGAGGTFEAGHSSRYGKPGGPTADGFYVIADGARANPSPLDGYAGISNYEKASGASCPQTDARDTDACSTNSGGAVGAAGGPPAPVPLLVCGDTSGPWDNSKRNGCFAD